MVGTHINRNITWAEQAKPFMTYLARNSLHAAAGAFRGGSRLPAARRRPLNNAVLGRRIAARPPEGYDYDYINTDALLNRMSVKEDGRLALPDGMSYRVLVLPENRPHDAAGGCARFTS